MKPRTAERYRLRSRLFFSSADVSIEGEGTIADLSKTGCCVESETQPPKGAELQLSLFLSDYSWPMKVDRAVVRWSKGHTFGVEFLAMQPAQRDRLVRTIMKLKQDAGY
jgi:hypothetical protein